ncbi:MAG: hypothetical protein A7315_10825 [Candidatus Altiarchaeales archaeon WOR_SM1_79]|nr:MAG: hypothetical protein A7315_10825 [Candidatus Altiarchaeales archaeon WOR_SM1_79]
MGTATASSINTDAKLISTCRGVGVTSPNRFKLSCRFLLIRTPTDRKAINTKSISWVTVPEITSIASDRAVSSSVNILSVISKPPVNIKSVVMIKAPVRFEIKIKPVVCTQDPGFISMIFAICTLIGLKNISAETMPVRINRMPYNMISPAAISPKCPMGTSPTTKPARISSKPPTTTAKHNKPRRT